ncbi:hypothetical protein [Paraburkholderia sp. SIMBA_053]|uniref:hypothetical protein n=1 Tax=Paraburkholderia sp. SIMBA_053 TaxID=3085794 RepID=UPI00397A0E7D
MTIVGETVSGKLTHPEQDWIVEHVGPPNALVKDSLDEARGDVPGGAAGIKQCHHVVAPVPSKQHAFANRRRRPQPGLRSAFLARPRRTRSGTHAFDYVVSSRESERLLSGNPVQFIKNVVSSYHGTTETTTFLSPNNKLCTASMTASFGWTFPNADLPAKAASDRIAPLSVDWSSVWRCRYCAAPSGTNEV